MKNNYEYFTQENKAIVSMLLKGYTISKMAIELNYSTSTISNKLSKLFGICNAKNKQEFIILFFAKIIKELKQKIKEKEEKLVKNQAMLNEVIYKLEEFNLKFNNKNLAILINKAKLL